MITEEKLKPVLMALLGSEDLIERWWTSPNKAFDNKPPRDVELRKVADYLLWHALR